MLAAGGGLATLAAAGAGVAQTPTVQAPFKERNDADYTGRVHYHPQKGQRSISPARCVSIRYFRCGIQGAYPQGMSRSNRVRVPPGTRIRSVRRSIITAGLGSGLSSEGGAVEEFRPGDVVWFPPELKHWHGASPTTAITHIAIPRDLRTAKRGLAGKSIDEQYRR